MAEKKELQEKILTYRILESRLDGLLKQREMVVSKLIEIQNTLGSMEEMEKTKSEKIMYNFPLGAGAYTIGPVIDKKKLIVEVGANIGIEKSLEEGKQILGKRKAEIENGLNNLHKEIAEISAALDQLGPEIQGMSEETEAD